MVALALGVLSVPRGDGFGPGARGNRRSDPTPVAPGDCQSFHKAEGLPPSQPSCLGS